MSESRKKKDEFFRLHPFCCFCGGETLASTMDHQPGRVFFTDRQWPEGFVFPACSPCNEWSRETERVMSLLIHGDSEKQNGRYLATVSSLRRTYPNLIDSMIPESNNEVRRILRSIGFQKPSNKFVHGLGLIKLDTDFWSDHFENFGRKIALSLHYQCFARPLPKSGGVKSWISTNVDFMDEDRFAPIKNLVGNLAEPRRSKNRLSNQFSIRWSFDMNTLSGLFICHFHSKIFLICITSENSELLAKIEAYQPPIWHS